MKYIMQVEDYNEYQVVIAQCFLYWCYSLSIEYYDSVKERLSNPIHQYAWRSTTAVVSVSYPSKGDNFLISD